MWRMVWLFPLFLVACNRGIQVQQKKKDVPSARGTTPVLEVGTKQIAVPIDGVELKACSDTQGISVSTLSDHQIRVQYLGTPSQPGTEFESPWAAFTWVNSANGTYFGRNWAYMIGGSASVTVPQVGKDTEFEVRVYPRSKGPYEMVARCRWLVRAQIPTEDTEPESESEPLGLKVTVGDMELNGSSEGMGYLIRFPKSTRSFTYEVSGLSKDAVCDFRSSGGYHSLENSFPYKSEEEIENGRGKLCIGCYRPEGGGYEYEGLCIEASEK